MLLCHLLLLLLLLLCHLLLLLCAQRSRPDTQVMGRDEMGRGEMGRGEMGRDEMRREDDYDSLVIIWIEKTCSMPIQRQRQRQGQRQWEMGMVAYEFESLNSHDWCWG